MCPTAAAAAPKLRAFIDTARGAERVRNRALRLKV